MKDIYKNPLIRMVRIAQKPNSHQMCVTGFAFIFSGSLCFPSSSVCIAHSIFAFVMRCGYNTMHQNTIRLGHFGDNNIINFMLALDVAPFFFSYLLSTATDSIQRLLFEYKCTRVMRAIFLLLALHI